MMTQGKPTPKLPDSVMEMFSLKGKVAAVSGAAANIGLAVVEAYAEAGAGVALWYHSNPIAITRAEEISKKYNTRVIAYKVDVTDYAQVEATVAQVCKDFGRLDIMVANAGITQEVPKLVDGNPTKWKDIIDTNLVSVLSQASIVGKIFEKQKSGSFIVTSSAASYRSVRGSYQSIYTATKAAVRLWCKSLAYEWADFARVNSVSPGYFGDGMDAPDEEIHFAYEQTVMNRMADYKELKGLYLFLASDASSFCTGSDYPVDGGILC